MLKYFQQLYLFDSIIKKNNMLNTRKKLMNVLINSSFSDLKKRIKIDRKKIFYRVNKVWKNYIYFLNYSRQHLIQLQNVMNLWL